LFVCSLFCAGTVAQQVMKVPVSASSKGNDEVGALLLPAIHQELSKSTAYSFRRDEPVSDAPEKNGLEFFIELATADAATNEQKHGSTSVVSIVIESIGTSKQLAGPRCVVPQDRDYETRSDQADGQAVRQRYGRSLVQHH
jgi:hypothetical protein